MDHTSATPTRAKRPKQAKASREKIPASGPRDPVETAPPQATAAAADDAMDTAGGAAAPAAVVPSGTDAFSFIEGANDGVDQGDSEAAKLNACKHVPQPALRGPERGGKARRPRLVGPLTRRRPATGLSTRSLARQSASRCRRSLCRQVAAAGPR